MLAVGVRRLREGIANKMKTYKMTDYIRAEHEESYPPTLLFFCLLTKQSHHI